MSFLTIILVVSLMLASYTSSAQTPEKNDLQRLTTDPSLPTILLWTQYYLTIWYVYNDPDIYKEELCPVRCTITSDRSLVRSSDAVLFNEYNFNRYDLPDVQYPNQKFVMYTREAYSDYLTSADLTKFNYTRASYRRESDIFLPYGYLARRNYSKHGPAKPVNYESKTKAIAWFVSNCFSKERNEYVTELQKYIDVDIYGGCGRYSCSSGTKDLCYEMVEREYKFYLSFENTMASEYVTEKFFSILRYNVIPIVMGDADYSRIAPKSAFINVKDYATPKDLANYLVTIDKDDYMKRMQWKADYVSVERQKTILCEVCKLLYV